MCLCRRGEHDLDSYFLRKVERKSEYIRFETEAFGRSKMIAIPRE